MKKLGYQVGQQYAMSMIKRAVEEGVPPVPPWYMQALEGAKALPGQISEAAKSGYGKAGEGLDYLFAQRPGPGLDVKPPEGIIDTSGAFLRGLFAPKEPLPTELPSRFEEALSKYITKPAKGLYQQAGQLAGETGEGISKGYSESAQAIKDLLGIKPTPIQEKTYGDIIGEATAPASEAGQNFMDWLANAYGSAMKTTPQETGAAASDILNRAVAAAKKVPGQVSEVPSDIQSWAKQTVAKGNY